jgi:hypothetical protein
MFGQLFNLSRVTGINLHIEKEGDITIDACEIEKTGKDLNILKTTLGLASIKQLAEKNTSKATVALNITGKGVLIKKISKVDVLTGSVFLQVLPNANMDDFYVQNFVSGEQSYVAIIRKSEADKYISQIEEPGFQVLMLSLGPFPSDPILQQLNVYNEETLFNGHRIVRDDQQNWQQYEYKSEYRSPFPLKIDVEKVEEQIVLPYASAFQLIMERQLNAVHADADGVQAKFQKVKENIQLKGYGVIFTMVLFGLLLSNFVASTWLTDENDRMSVLVSKTQKSTNDLSSTVDSIKAKVQTLQLLGWDGGINKARLIDELASVMPEELTLSKIEVTPIDINQSRNLKTAVFNDRLIRITGSSAKIIPVNEWIQRVKSKKWVKDVQLESYSVNPETKSGQFTITISF